MTSIGTEAFSECQNLKSIVWPTKMVETNYKVPGLAYRFFWRLGAKNFIEQFQAKQLSVVSVFRDDLSCVGQFAAAAMKVEAIPPNVKEIGVKSFQGSSFSAPISMPKCLEIVRNWAFWDAKMTQDNLDVPGSLKEIGPGAFVTHHPPKTVRLGPGVTPWVREWFSPFSAKEAFVVDSNNETFCARDGVLFSKDGTVLVSVPQGVSGAFMIPECVTRIAMGAFFNCRLLQSVRIPSSVTDLPTQVFLDCHSLVECEISPSVKTIGDDAFWNCRSLQHIRLPQNSVIGNGAFYGCVQLVTAEFDATVQFSGKEHFFGCECLSQETRDRFRAYTGEYPVIANSAGNG